MHSYIDLKLESDVFQEVACFTQQFYELSVYNRQFIKN